MGCLKEVQRWGHPGFWTLFILVLLSRPCHASQGLSVTPPVLKIDSFFGGAEVLVSAEIPEGCEAVIEVAGREVEEDLMRKGRRWELWMNVGEIDVDGAPCLYLLMSSAPGLINAGNRPWGYEALRKKISFKGKFRMGEVPELYREFIRLKEGQGLYGIFPGAIEISPLNGTRSLARASFRLPTRIPQGVHRVFLFVIRDGQTIERKSVPFKVMVAGLPAFLVFLSSRHAGFYGIFSVSLAVAAGFLSGFLFKGRRRRKSGKGDHCEEDEGDEKSGTLDSKE
jgi:hypothetical protein